MASHPVSASERPALAARATATALGLLLATFFVLPVPARAQVIEIASDGAVAVYDRPAVFTDAGVQPIPLARPTRSPALPDFRPRAARKFEVMQELSAAASAYGLAPELVHAVAWRESRFRHDAVSSAGATGVMQLMPGTARTLGVDRFDLRQNIYGGTAYLRRMLDEFGGDVGLALAAYNAGPAAVRRYGGTPPYAETQQYVAAIMGRLAAPAAALTPIR